VSPIVAGGGEAQLRSTLAPGVGFLPEAPLPAQLLEDSNEVTLNGKRVPTFFTFIANTDPGSNAGIPGLALPMGMTAGALPLGIELDGPSGSDRRLLSIGLALEVLLGPVPAPKR
jgi:mandelamide amidase